MKILQVTLNTSETQAAALRALQSTFAEACNTLAPIVQQTRCWNRVALHHLAYRSLRERFPQLGSQMACNAIYSVSRTCRLVLQHPQSPWNVGKNPDRPLPVFRFLPGSPVYFDRHTLSLKDDQLSMFTLDGRMRFQVNLAPDDARHFVEAKLLEVSLSNGPAGYQLSFHFADRGEDAAPAGPASMELPTYLVVCVPESAEPSTPSVPALTATASRLGAATPRP